MAKNQKNLKENIMQSLLYMTDLSLYPCAINYAISQLFQCNNYTLINTNNYVSKHVLVAAQECIDLLITDSCRISKYNKLLLIY